MIAGNVEVKIPEIVLSCSPDSYLVHESKLTLSDQLGLGVKFVLSDTRRGSGSVHDHFLGLNLPLTNKLDVEDSVATCA